LTGNSYSLETNSPTDPAVLERLISAKSDDEQIIKKRHKDWKDTLELLEEHYKTGMQLF
jgi:hypothetical protein